MVLSILCGLAYMCYEAKCTNQNAENYIDLVTIAIPISIIFARAYYVAFSWDYYKDNLIKIFAITEGGIAVYGSFIGAVITVIIFCKMKKLKFWLFVDTAVPGFMLGQVIGRYGNFFNREAHGGFTDSIFAMRYLIEPHSYIPQNLQNALVSVDGYDYLQVHPTFLYESLWNLTFFIFINIYKTRKKFDGEIFAIYLASYGIGRFWIEGLRTDNLLIWGTNVAISQVVAVLTVGFAIILYLKMKKEA